MTNSGLIIRKSERFEISLPARARIAFSHAELVKLSKGASSQDGWVNVQLMDLSDGGFGMLTTQFFPRGSLIELQVQETGDFSQEPTVSCELRVMRIQMTDRRPAYLVGGIFVNLTESTKKQIENLLDRLDGEGDKCA